MKDKIQQLSITIYSRILIIILFAIVCIFSKIEAGTPGSANPKLVSQSYLNSSQPFVFMENRGQLADENGKLLNDISYYGHQNGVNVYCRSNKLSFVFTKQTEEKSEKAEDSLLPEKFRMPGKSTVETARMDMCFLNANANPIIQSEDDIEYYTNYYLAHTPEEGITHVRSFKKLTYKNLYPNIDLVLHSKEKGMEYEFLVHPGGKVSDIQVQWLGADKIQPTPECGIHYVNILGEMNESMPVSFTSASKVVSRFLVQDNIVRFEVGEFDKTQTLVIDPVLVWGTYFGGSELDEGRAIHSDGGMNIYLAGQTLSSSGIASSGAFQTKFNGSSIDYQAYLTTFDNSGKRLWSTYFGGYKSTIAFSVTSDSSGNVIIAGNTASTNSIATSSAYQTSMAGGASDAFMAKFSASGKRKWSTYYGGNAEDYNNDLCVDRHNNIYMTGYTKSTNGIASGGSYLSTGGGVKYDGFIAKIDSSGNRAWSSYFGGKRDDIIYGICTDTTGNVYITGSTLSSNNIATSSAFQTNLWGGDTSKNDVFLSKFNSSGNIIWSTYFGGESRDMGQAVCTDDSGNVYICGSTLSQYGIAYNAYQNTYGGITDVFLAKFDGTGKRNWATYYGGSSGEIVADICNYKGNIFLTGVSNSANQISTNNAYKKYLSGNSEEVYLTEFSIQGKLIYGTYYGGIGYDGSNGITSDTLGNVYITGYTGSQNGIATTGMYQTTNAGIWDAFVAQFSFLTGCSTRSQILGDTLVCAHSNQTYYTISQSGMNYLWNISGGIISKGANTDSIGVSWDEAGKGFIQIIGLKKLCTNILNIPITILPLPQTKILQIRISALDRILLSPDTNFVSYHWFFGDGKDSISTYHINHTYPKDSSYKVTLVTTGTNGCQATMDTLLKVYTYLDKQSNPISLPLSIKPNPFTDQTTISYILPTESMVQITLWDMAGRQVADLTNSMQPAGEHDCLINAANLGLGTGNYLVKIAVDGQVVTRQVVKVE